MPNHTVERAQPFANSHQHDGRTRRARPLNMPKWVVGGIVLLLGWINLAQSQDVAKEGNRADSLKAILTPQPPVRSGESATQLPDGRWLLLGGDAADKTPTADAGIVNPANGSVTPLAAKLRQARRGHTATLLPDGTVLILGGVDAAGALSSMPNNSILPPDIFRPWAISV